MTEQEFGEWWDTLTDEQRDRGMALLDGRRQDYTKQTPAEHLAALQTIHHRSKCEHTYNPIRHPDGSTKGTLILDRYKDKALNRPNQYRCLKCDRIMRRSGRGRLYYVRCDVGVDGKACGKHARLVAFDHTQHRRVWVGQTSYAYCAEHSAPPEKPKPKAAPRTILRKGSKKTTGCA
jgi:hypothetical protein